MTEKPKAKGRFELLLFPRDATPEQMVKVIQDAHKRNMDEKAAAKKKRKAK